MWEERRKSKLTKMICEGKEYDYSTVKKGNEGEYLQGKN